MEELINLLKEGVSAGHVIQYMKNSLLEHGFQELSLDETWNLKNGGKYYVNLYGTNGLAFCVGNDIKTNVLFRIGMAHSDYPCFQLKPGIRLSEQKATQWNVEIYGGMYQKSWLDRPLGVAGSVIVKGENVFAPKTLLYKSEKALAVIPSLAIHMDRDLNKKGALDVAKELVPIAGLNSDMDLLDEVADSLKIKKEDILDYDLFLYNMQDPVLVGLDQSLLLAPKLDNLTSVSALLTAFCEDMEVPDNTIDGMVVWDNEEVGSRTKQGADSRLLSCIVEKIGKSLLKDFDLNNVLKNGFLLSVDVAHAHHPNYEEKSDSFEKAYLGHGFSIKRSVGQKYGTTANTAAVLKQICDRYEIPYTIAINKTGIAGGSTLGPIATSHLPMPCADIGMPILAMHSASELGAVADYEALQNLIRHFYEI